MSASVPPLVSAAHAVPATLATVIATTARLGGPRCFYDRVITYFRDPSRSSAFDFLERHRDSPALFVGGRSYLWSASQQRELTLAFGMKTLKPREHLLGLVGPVRLCAANSATYEVDQKRAVSVRTALGRIDAGHHLVLHDVSLASVLPLTAKGPGMFRPCDLLAAAPRSPQHDPAINQLLVGSRGSFTPAHVDFFGCDGYLQLLSGAKVWACAPPEHRAEFMALFRPDARVIRRRADRHLPLRGPAKKVGSLRHQARKHARATMAFSDFTPRQLETMREHGYMFIEQRAGDVVYIPAGWPHAVKNRTHTVAMGCSYLRPWKVHFTLAFVDSGLCSPSEALSRVPVDFAAVMAAFAAGEWPIMPEAKRRLVARAAAIQAGLDAADAEAVQRAAADSLAAATYEPIAMQAAAHTADAEAEQRAAADSLAAATYEPSAMQAAARTATKRRKRKLIGATDEDSTDRAYSTGKRARAGGVVV